MRLRVGRCICAIRLHVLILVTTAIETAITGGRHVLVRESARERDPTLQALLRSLHRMEEEVRPFLTPEEMLFVFADVPRSSFRIVMWSVPKVASINALGVERLLQWLLLLKGSLAPITNVNPSASAMQAYAASASEAALDATQTYLRLLQGHTNNIVLEASRPEKRRKLSTMEWLSLLDVNVEGRKVTKAQRSHLRSSLDISDLSSPLQESSSIMESSDNGGADEAPVATAAPAGSRVRSRVASLISNAIGSQRPSAE